VQSGHVKTESGLVDCADLACALVDPADGPAKSVWILGASPVFTLAKDALFLAQNLLKFGAKINTQQ